METLATTAGVATDLPMVEDQRKSVGQQPNHRQDHERRALVDRRMFEVAVRRQGLKHFGVDTPTAAAQLIDE